MPDMNPDTSAEALAQVLAGHAALLWGAPRAADLQDSLTQAAQDSYGCSAAVTRFRYRAGLLPCGLNPARRQRNNDSSTSPGRLRICAGNP